MSESTREEPVVSGEERLMDHTYDGISEFDNPMPRWWVWIFWGTFWFSCAYVFHYWVGNGTGVNQDFEAESELARKEAAALALKQTVTEETLSTFMADGASVTAGAATFAGKCLACHGDQGQGLIGPNLTDPNWIHGKGTLLDIYHVVSEGVAAKGMPAWDKQLTPKELREVVAFVGTLRGKNVSGKAPEGAATSP